MGSSSGDVDRVAGTAAGQPNNCGFGAREGEVRGAAWLGVETACCQ
jgi:hypothetical protein